MTTDHPPIAAARFAPGTRGFIAVLSLTMGMTALAIDSMLPAFPDIRAEFGYAADSTAVAGLVTAFMAGLGVGQLPAGLLADRFGRRPILIGGIALYIFGAVASMLAPTLPLMVAARFLWGLGSAGPRVASVAMVRDAYSGEQMAKMMSYIMAVFLLVPMIAPTIGSGLLVVGNWRLIFGFTILVGVLAAVLSGGLPTTLPVEERRLLSASEVWQSWKIVLATPGMYGYLIGMTAVFSSFLTYISSAELIIDEIFGLADWFFLIFGLVALCLAGAVLTNGTFVERIGLDKVLRVGPLVLNAFTLMLLALSLATDGRPPFALFLVALTLVMVTLQVLYVNSNSAAMVPLGHVAGSGSALLGMVPMVGGAAIGSYISSLYNGTFTPFAIAFVVAGVVCLGGFRWALAAAPLDRRT